MHTAADELVSALKQSGVRFVFGIPSIHNISIYEALRKESAIRHILCRHETTAAHMADGFTRALWCGRQESAAPAAVIASTGPGTCYLAPAVLEAWESSSPILIVTTDIPSNVVGKGVGSLHELKDQHSIFRNITKKIIRVQSAGNIDEAAREAIKAAVSGRPGPVYLEIPTDLLKQNVLKNKEHAIVPEAQTDTLCNLDKALDLLNRSKRPMIITGISAVRAGLSKEISTLSRILNAPVITTTEGKGIIPEDSELSFGNAAQKGLVQKMAKTSDLAIAVGTRLREVDGKRRELQLQKLIHVDWDDVWINRNFTADVSLVGDIRAIVRGILNNLDPDKGEEKSDSWIRDLIREKSGALEKIHNSHIELQYIDAIRSAIPREGVLVIDNTLLGYWAEYFYPSYRPGGLIAGRGASTIGYAFPAAIGVKIAHPKDKVVGLIGDGGFLYCAQELATCKRHKIGFPLVISNDNAFGIIRYLQRKFYGEEFESSLTNPDFVALANSFGVQAVRVDTPSLLYDSLQRALASEEMLIIEVQASFREPSFGRY